VHCGYEVSAGTPSARTQGNETETEKTEAETSTGKPGNTGTTKSGAWKFVAQMFAALDALDALQKFALYNPVNLKVLKNLVRIFGKTTHSPPLVKRMAFVAFLLTAPSTLQMPFQKRGNL